jgi:NADH-quinone oxidoreductase subunit N
MNCICGLWLALPELIIFSAALCIILLGAFWQSKRIFYALGLTFAIFALYAAFLSLGYADQAAFNQLYISDGFAKVAKLIILSLLTILLVISRHNLRFCEYFALLLLATLGMLLAVSANDLILLYLSLELQSLALYVLVAIERNKPRSLEAGVKYFILSSVASAITIYGFSLIYGFTGTTNLTQLANLEMAADMPLILGFALVLSGMLFKVSAVPFHMWTPDVYQGAPIEVTMLLATISKFTGILILIRLLAHPLHSLHNQQIIALLAILSIILGSLGAMRQQDIKKFMAYGSIAHIGYILLALVAGTREGFIAAILYTLIYLISAVGMFTIIIYLIDDSSTDLDLDYSIEGVGRRISGFSFVSFAVAIFMFSMAGLPPLVGFFAKFHVFMSIMENKMFVLAIISIVASILSIAYYLRIIKIVCFSRAESCAINGSKLLFGIIFLAAVSNLALFAAPSIVKNTAIFMVESLGY